MSLPLRRGGLDLDGTHYKRLVQEVILCFHTRRVHTWRTHAAAQPAPIDPSRAPDVWDYGDSVLAWSPGRRNGDSAGQVLSDADAVPVTVHNITKSMNFSYNPSKLLEDHGYTEFIELKFAIPVFPTSVVIGENRGMCSVVRIQGRSSRADSSFVDLWHGAPDAACHSQYVVQKRYRIFQPIICQHSVEVDVVRIELNTRAIDDWNEIDYVELLGTSTPQAGVLPLNTTGVWYLPDAGFIGNDTMTIIPYDCPFDRERAGVAAVVPITVAGDFPSPSPPPLAVVPVVRLGVLLPSLNTAAWAPLAGVYQALREVNDKSDGVADHLLPNTRIQFAYMDSKCDPSTSLSTALHLTRNAFNQAGVSAIIGAGCSGASEVAAQVAQAARVPIISPSATSPALSDGKGYPFFLRTIPSGALGSAVMVELLQMLWNYTGVALGTTA